MSYKQEGVTSWEKTESPAAEPQNQCRDQEFIGTLSSPSFICQSQPWRRAALAAWRWTYYLSTNKNVGEIFLYKNYVQYVIANNIVLIIQEYLWKFPVMKNMQTLVFGISNF